MTASYAPNVSTPGSRDHPDERERGPEEEGHPDGDEGRGRVPRRQPAPAQAYALVKEWRPAPARNERPVDHPLPRSRRHSSAPGASPRRRRRDRGRRAPAPARHRRRGARRRGVQPGSSSTRGIAPSRRAVPDKPATRKPVPAPAAAPRPQTVVIVLNGNGRTGAAAAAAHACAVAATDRRRARVPERPRPASRATSSCSAGFASEGGRLARDLGVKRSAARRDARGELGRAHASSSSARSPASAPSLSSLPSPPSRARRHPSPGATRALRERSWSTRRPLTTDPHWRAGAPGGFCLDEHPLERSRYSRSRASRSTDLGVWATAPTPSADAAVTSPTTPRPRPAASRRRPRGERSRGSCDDLSRDSSRRHARESGLGTLQVVLRRPPR